MVVKRSLVVLVAAAVGCSGRTTDLTPLHADAPAVLDPGYVYWPLLPRWRAPTSVPSCHPSLSDTTPAPAIEILSAGGTSGDGTGNVQIWEDGTVLFDGLGCPQSSHRRGKLPAARVRALLDSPTAVSEAIALVMVTVGKNACSPSCRQSPAPAFCQ